jgi:signal transduction histidine kinase/CheY-like chemotaxis protein
MAMLKDNLLELTHKLAKVGGWAVMYGEEKTLFWTPGTFDILEIPQDSIPPLETLLSYVIPEYRDDLLHKIDACRNHGHACDVEFEFQTVNNQRKWIHLIAEAKFSNVGRVLQISGAIQDITAQKMEEQQNKVLSNRMLVTLENMSDAFYLLDSDWRLLYVNRATDKLLPNFREQGLGKIIWDEFPYMRHTPIYVGFQQAVSDKQPFHFEYFSALMDNWIEIDAFPSPAGLAVYFHSITEKKQLKERLDQAQHMESIGKLTGHVAHDFNNLLTIILGNADLLAMLIPDDDHKRIATNIKTAALRGSELTKRLLSYARKQTLAPRPVDINLLVEGMHELLIRTLGVNIRIGVFTQPNLPKALVDEHQLEGALLNLCLNARDAMPYGGSLTITTRARSFSKHAAMKFSDFTAGDYIQIAVTDTGTGIAPEIIKQVFEPFFTTKELGKGTGLGLSSVYGFAKQSNGHVQLQSSVGKGTTVELYLPVCLTTDPVTDNPAEETQGGSETILLVDDDELVRNAAQMMLTTSLGYQVVAVSNGETALSVLRGHTRIDLLFTDVMMPGLNGFDLAMQALLLRPGLRVLLTSGFANTTLQPPDGSGVEFPLLPKPYSVHDLARKLREVFDHHKANPT